jgi:DnaJ-class molecular chaperone
VSDDLYKTLGLKKGATKAEIKKARKSKAQKLHPDRNKDPAAARELATINAAADTLEDDEKRRRYDQGEDPTNRPQSREQQARHTVMQFMNEAIGLQPKVNVPKYVLNRLEARRPEIAGTLAQMKQRRAEFEKRLDEVTTDDPDNIFRDLIDGFIRNLSHEIEQGEEALEVLKISIEIARRYKSDVSAPIQRYPAPGGTLTGMPADAAGLAEVLRHFRTL